MDQLNNGVSSFSNFEQELLKENPLAYMNLFRHYEVMDYVSMTNHMWSGFNLLGNLAAWRRIPADIQGIIDVKNGGFSGWRLEYGGGQDPEQRRTVATEAQNRIGDEVDRPVLFGDVNGDGRDEACRFTGDRFVCGVYAVSGGVPTDTIEIVFGQPGDIPLLGDLDAF